MPAGLTVNQVVAVPGRPGRGRARVHPGGPAGGARRSDAALHGAAPEQASLEGTLFPETHSLEEGDTELIFLKRVVGELDATLAELDITNRAAQVGLTPYEVMVVASLVEEEARRRGPGQGGPGHLQPPGRRRARSSSTPRRATRRARTPATLSLIDWGPDTPYNTRTRAGLPPTPIASPGRASIEAALATRRTVPGGGTSWPTPTGTTPSPTTTTSSCG